MTVDLNDKILKQLDFYFGDANMPRDKFLLEQASKNSFGWIPIELIASFQRMRSITSDLELIKQVLKSAESLVFEVSEDGENVKRRKPLPEENMGLMEKSAYVKGFPADTPLDTLLSFFAVYKVSAVRMRRFPKTKEFKGSVFVEFLSAAELDTFLAAPPTTFQDSHQLEVLSKMAYFERKNTSKTSNFEDELERIATEYVRGCLVKVTGVPQGTAHQQVKADLAQKLEGLEVAFVEQQQDGMTFVRLKEPKGVELLAACDSNEIVIENAKCALALPSEEEEATYYRNLAAVLMAKRAAAPGGKNKRTGNKFSSNKSAPRNNSSKREADSENEQEEKKAKHVNESDEQE